MNKISWSSQKVFIQLKASLNLKTQTYLLDKKWEYNDEGDVKEFSSYLNNELCNWLISYSSDKELNISEFISSILYDYSQTKVNRGPPMS